MHNRSLLIIITLFSSAHLLTLGIVPTSSTDTCSERTHQNLQWVQIPCSHIALLPIKPAFATTKQDNKNLPWLFLNIVRTETEGLEANLPFIYYSVLYPTYSSHLHILCFGNAVHPTYHIYDFPPEISPYRTWTNCAINLEEHQFHVRRRTVCILARRSVYLPVQISVYTFSASRSCPCSCVMLSVEYNHV
jgi:hypothetical protein